VYCRYLSWGNHGRKTSNLFEDFVEVGLVGIVDVLLDGLGCPRGWGPVLGGDHGGRQDRCVNSESHFFVVAGLVSNGE